MTLLEYLKSELLIKKVRLAARKKMWGDQADRFCLDDEAVIKEIERQIYELEGGI